MEYCRETAEVHVVCKLLSFVAHSCRRQKVLLGRHLVYRELYQGPWGEVEDHENADGVLHLAGKREKLK